MAHQWYIVHTYSGFEKKVAQGIREEAAKKGLSESFEDVVVPVEEVTEVRKGRKVQAEKKFFPGYVLVKMELNDHTWQLVRHIPRVTGFLGNKERPQPVPQREVDKIFRDMSEGAEKPRTTITYEIGEAVKVTDGPFESFIGSVEDVDNEKQRIKVSVSIFGRATPVELDFSQVERVE